MSTQTIETLRTTQELYDLFQLCTQANAQGLPTTSILEAVRHLEALRKLDTSADMMATLLKLLAPLEEP